MDWIEQGAELLFTEESTFQVYCHCEELVTLRLDVDRWSMHGECHHCKARWELINQPLGRFWTGS